MTVVAKFSELESGTAHKVMVDGVAVAVVRIEDELFAIADTCSHADISLSLGMVWCDTKQIECIKHGSAFNLVTGQPDTFPATQPVAVYSAKVVNDEVIVESQKAKS
jgi:3-phenylpropionate/trans-cinnamate dioxygenase ferredoxin subunit